MTYVKNKKKVFITLRKNYIPKIKAILILSYDVFLFLVKLVSYSSITKQGIVEYSIIIQNKV